MHFNVLPCYYVKTKKIIVEKTEIVNPAILNLFVCHPDKGQENRFFSVNSKQDPVRHVENFYVRRTAFGSRISSVHGAAGNKKDLYD